MALQRQPARLIFELLKQHCLLKSQRQLDSKGNVCRLSSSSVFRHRCRRHSGTKQERTLPKCLTTQTPTSPRLKGPSPLPSGHPPLGHPPVAFCSTSRDHVASNAAAKPSSSIVDIDPYKVVHNEMSSLATDIRKTLGTDCDSLRSMSHYYFDGKGKTFRPLVVLLMAKTCNHHAQNSDKVLWTQRVVAMIAEMIHTASLVHDDVIDASDTRRGQDSLNKLHGQRMSILTGDYILSQASIILARTNNTHVISVLSSVLEDLVSGEFMQLGSKENEDERFAHYLKKTYKKTASLIANTCKSVAILGECNENTIEAAFEFGRNLGIAFQLIDDLLDFTSCDSTMGKPTAADLRLGLATAPVLFAAQEYPDLHALIMRRFSEKGDVEYARSCVAKSQGVEQTLLLATSHSREAVQNLGHFSPSLSQKALVRLAQMLLDRKK